MASYDRWLDEARAWPPTSSCWSSGEVEQFLAEFGTLVASVRNEREVTFEALKDALALVSHEHAQSLSYIGWTLRTPSEISAAASLDAASASVETCAHLIDELQSLQRYLAAPPGHGFDSQQQWFTAVRQHVDAAHDLLRRLSPFFQEVTAIPDVPAQEDSSPVGSEPEPTPHEKPDDFDDQRLDTAVVEAEAEPIAVIAKSNVGNLEPVADEAEIKSVDMREEPAVDSVIKEPLEEIRFEEIARDVAFVEPEEPAVALPAEEKPADAIESGAIIKAERQWLDAFLASLTSATRDDAEAELYSSPAVDSAAGSIDAEALRTMFWNRIDTGDIAAAYWFARALGASGEEPPIAAKTIAAIHALGIYWLQAKELEEHCSLVLDYQEPLSDAARLVVLASGIRLAVAAPVIAQTRDTTFDRALRAEPGIDELKPIIRAVRDYANEYQPLQRGHAAAIQTAQRREAATTQTRTALKDWLEKAQSKKMPMPQATDIFQKWAVSGRMHKDANPVLRNDFAAVADVSRSAQWWDDEDKVGDALNKEHRKRKGTKHVNDIEFTSLGMVLRLTQEFSKLLRNWCDSVGASDESSETVPAQVITLRERLLIGSERLTSSIQQAQGANPEQAAAMRHLHRELATLYETLAVPLSGPAPQGLLISESWYSGSKSSLDLALRRRLELVPDLEVGDELDIDERLPAIATALAASISDTQAALTAERWLSRGDFRSFDRFLEAMGTAPLAAQLREAAARRRNEWIARLRDEITAAMKDVQGAAIGTWLPNAEAERFNDELQGISTSDVLLFPPQIARVHEIRRCCHDALVERLSGLVERWHALAGQLLAGDAEPRLVKRVSELFHEALEAHDVRPADMLLNELAAFGDPQEGLNEALEKLIGGSPARRMSNFDRFLERESAIGDWLHENSDIWGADPEDPRYLPDRILRASTIVDGTLLMPRSDQRRKESADAVKHWMQLRASTPEQTIKHVEAILTFLGFVHKQVEAKGQGAGSLFLTARMSAGNHAPVPQWGSESHNREHHILVIGRKADLGTIRERIAVLPRHKEPLLVIYLEQLEPRARRELSAFAKAEREPLLVLDDVLLLFLTQCNEHRLRPFFECALPFSATNPYVKDFNGPVAPEMFQGHKDAITKLMDRRGTCFICGGRQLGKSALQNYIQKQFDRQTPNRHVWYISIKDSFDTPHRRNADAIWSVLYERFCEARLLTRNAALVRAETIARQLKQVFEVDAALEVTIFLDEADELLEAMISDRRRVWTAVTTLMDDTARRLKIVFAGNYHISRFAMQRNQSATIMGSPIEIGPMEFAAATDLIEKPLQALGYRIERRTVLTILSLTYRHASLLQLLMHALLEGQMDSGRLGGPPWDITQADVDKAYKTSHVQQAMRHRIELTLELDPEYCALAYAMLLDQEGSGDFRRSYDTTELKEKAVALWPQRFQSLTNADVEARLVEMQGVGVVRRSGERFRLSGPHLISLFGDYDKIRARARDLAEKQPRSKFDESAVHGWLDRTAGRYSPLTLVKERQLQHKQTGIRLLFLSPAGGGGLIDEAVRTLQGPAAEAAPLDCIIPDGLDSKETIIWLRVFRKRLNTSHGIALQHLRLTSSSLLLRHVSDIQSHCRGVENTGQTFQVAFVLDPAEGWAWHQIDEPERRPFEHNAIDTARWDAHGIRSRLEDLGKIFTPRAADDVLRATSGWHLLLQSLLDSWPPRTEDPAPVCESLTRKLNDPASDVSRAFDDGLGVERGSRPESALLTLAQYGEPLTIDEARDLADQDAAAIAFLQRYGLIAPQSDGRFTADSLAVAVRSQTIGGPAVVA